MTLTILNMVVFAQKDTIKDREVGVAFSNLNSFGFSYKGGNENTLFRITAMSLTGASNSSNYNSYVSNAVNGTAPSSPSSSFGFGLNVGIEKRKQSNKFYFAYGLVLTNSYSYSNSNTTTPTPNTINYFHNNVYIPETVIVNNNSQSTTWTISPGLGIVIGVTYKLNHSFSIGAELIPSVTYNYTETKTNSTIYNIGWITNNNEPYTVAEDAVNTNSDKITKGINFSVINTGAAITIAYRIK